MSPPVDATPPRRILLIALGGAGDGLMATPLLRPLHACWPEAAIDVLVMQGEAARAMFAGHPLVRETILHPFMTVPWRDSLACCRSLRRRRYDLSLTVMPQNRLEYNLVTRLIGARRRLGFDYAIRCGAMGRWLLTDRVPEDPAAHLIENNLRLLREGLGIPAPDGALELPLGAEAQAVADAFWRTHDLGGRVVIGLHPGSGTTKNLALRRWPPAAWADLAARLVAADARRTLMLLGSPEEQALRATIRAQARLSPERLLEPPPMPILATSALIGRLDQLICTDTLLTHLAAAVHTPAVVIMGPTPHTSVYPWRTPHRIVRLGLPCSPCYGYSRHGIRCTHPEPFACLTHITAVQVQGAVDALLVETAARA